jgi:hypothetical protein
VHLCGVAFKEAAAAANEKGIPSENGFLRTIGEVVAYAVLSMTGCMQCGYCYGTDVEGGVVGRGGCDRSAIFTADYGNREMLELRLSQIQFGREYGVILTISVLPPAWSW